MKQLVTPGLGLLALISVAAAAVASTQAIPIADVVDVVKNAFHTPPDGSEAPANVGDKLLANEAIRTETDSAIEMSFPDGATLRLEGDSDLVLDSYVFDPSALKSAAAIGLNSGLLRYTTGEVSTDDSGVAFSTPVATVGIRGTDIVVSVGKDGSTVIDVLEGKVTAKPKEHETAVEAVEGQSVLIGKIDEPAQVGEIGSFSTAAGLPTNAPPGLDTDSRGTGPRGQQSKGPSGNGSSGGDGGGDNGGGDSGGGDNGGGDGGGNNGGADGDGNSGHGDNSDKKDPDNPGRGGGKGGNGGNGGKK